MKVFIAGALAATAVALPVHVYPDPPKVSQSTRILQSIRLTCYSTPQFPLDYA